MWVSPYRRAQETADRIYDECSGWIKDRRDNVLLGEQDFGLFAGLDIDKIPKLFPHEFAHFQRCITHEGKFWARFPLGESRFDVARRVHQTFGALHYDAYEQGVHDVVIVSHGVTLRAFVMMWLQKSVAWFEQEPNPANCSIRVLEAGQDKGYIFKGFPRRGRSVRPTQFLEVLEKQDDRRGGRGRTRRQVGSRLRQGAG